MNRAARYVIAGLVGAAVLTAAMVAFVATGPTRALSAAVIFGAGVAWRVQKLRRAKL